MDTSQSNAHHYAALLHTVSELRADLEKSTSKMKLLEEQNYSLSNNYAIVKDELIETRKKYNETKENYLSAVAEKFEMERKHESFVERLKIQLAEKTREFESIRDKLVPHDIDQLRIKVQEELEIQHKQELKLVESEVEAQREKFFLLKREFEKTKVEYATLIQNQQQEIFALRAEKDTLDESFRKDLSMVLSSDPSLPIRDDKLRAQAARANELTHLAEKLREEAASLRKDKDNAVYALEEYKTKTDQQLNSLKTKNAVLEAERAGYQEKISRLELEVEKKEVSYRNMKFNNEELTHQIEESLKYQQELSRQLSVAKSEAHSEVDLLKVTHQDELREQYDLITTLNGRIQEREEQLRRMQREISELQLRFESNEAELRRYHQSQAQELRKKYANLELEALESKQNLRLIEEQIGILQEQNLLEKDAFTSELSRIKKEKDFLHAKIREYENHLDMARKKFLTLQNENFQKVSLLEKRCRDLIATMTSLEMKNETMSTRNIELEKDRNQLEFRTEELTKKLDHYKRVSGGGGAASNRQKAGTSVEAKDY